MSVRMMTLVWELALPDSEKLVLLALADCANDEGHCWPGMPTLTKKCSKSDRTIQLAIKMLCVKGHLTRREVVGKGCNYTVHPIVRLADPRSGLAPEVITPPKPVTQTPEAASGKPSRTINSKKDKPSSRPRAKKPSHPLPEDWQPKQLKPGGVCDQIVVAWQSGRIERELSKFKDHHLRSDVRWSDWDAAWRTWIQRAGDFENGRSNTLGRNQPSDGLSSTARAALQVFGPG